MYVCVRFRTVSSDRTDGKADHHRQPFLIQYRRYSPLVADLKFVLNIPGVSAHFASSGESSSGHDSGDGLGLLGRWSRTVLEELQYLHPQKRVAGAHVAYEPRDWMYAFNVQISLCHVLDCLLGWVRSAGAAGARAAEEQGAALGAASPSVLRVGQEVSACVGWLVGWLVGWFVVYPPL